MAGFAPASNNRLCNLYSKPFFPIVPYHPCDVLLIRLRQPLRGGNAARRVHAHVQRSLEAKGETPLRVVDLGRADAQVEQYPGDLPPARQRRRHLGEAGVLNGEAGIHDGARLCDCCRILVEGHQCPGRAQPGQNCPAVPPSAEGAVHVDAIGPPDQGFDSLVQQHGAMAQGGGPRRLG